MGQNLSLFVKSSLSVLALGGAVALAQVPLIPAGKVSDTASAQIENRDPHIHRGSDIALRVKLDRPLPEGASFKVQLSPVTGTQTLDVFSSSPIDHDRKDFLLSTHLPQEVVPGQWHIAQVWVFMPGTSGAAPR